MVDNTREWQELYGDRKKEVDVWGNRQINQSLLYHMDIRYIIPDHRTRLVVVIVHFKELFALVGKSMGMYGILWVLRTI